MNRNRLDRYGPDAPRPGLHMGTKILLGITILCMLLSAAMTIVGGNEAMFVYTWAQLGMPFIATVLLLALIVPGARRFVKSPIGKKVATVITCTIVGLAALVVYSFIYTYQLVAPNPHSYHTSPDGKNRIVVMTYINPEALNEEEQQLYVIAFPMKNRLFFYDTDAQPIYDDNNFYPSYRVDWVSDEEAVVSISEFSGEGNAELTVNMNDRRSAADEIQSAATADPGESAPEGAANDDGAAAQPDQDDV